MVENCVRTLRLQLGMTQEALAERVGVSRQTIIAIERGGYVPSVLLALRLAEALARAIDQVFWLSSE
jgi:putative transcriptional regulator